METIPGPEGALTPQQMDEGSAKVPTSSGIIITTNPLVEYETNSTGAAIQAEKSALGFIFTDHALSQEVWLKWVFHKFRNLQHEPDTQIASVEELIRGTIGYFWERGERLASPLVTVDIEGGDCDDMAILANAILEAMGHEWRYVFIRVKNSPGWHVYGEGRNAMSLTKPWVPIDPSMPIGKRGYEIPEDQIEERVTFERKDVDHLQFPAHLLAALWCHPRQMVHIEGGSFGASGINYLRAEDLSLFPHEAAGKLFDKIKAGVKKIAPKIKAAAKKITGLISKIAASPLVQGAANAAYPGAGAALATAGRVAGGLSSVLGHEKAADIMEGAMTLVGQLNPKLGGALNSAVSAVSSALVPDEIKDLLGIRDIQKTPEQKATLNEWVSQQTPELLASLGLKKPSKPSTPTLQDTPVDEEIEPPSHTPLLEQVANRSKMEPREKDMFSRASQKQVPRLDDYKLNAIQQNTRLLDFLGTEDGKQLLESFDEDVQNQLRETISKRQQVLGEKSQRLASRLVEAISLTDRSIPSDVKDVLKLAADADQLTAVNDAWNRLIREALASRASSTQTSQQSVDYANIQNRHLKLMGDREQLIKDVISRIKEELPSSSDTGNLLEQDLIGRNLGDSYLLLFGSGIPKAELEGFIYRLKDLWRSINELNSVANTLRRGIAA
jgi:hypothetical protein